MVKSALKMSAALSTALTLATPATANDWDFTVSVHGWNAYRNFALGLTPNPGIFSSGGIFDNVDSVFLFSGIARTGAWSIFAEFNQLNLTDVNALSSVVGGAPNQDTDGRFGSGLAVTHLTEPRVRAWN